MRGHGSEDELPRLSFLGLGYVGLTTAVCFASRGFKVSCYDVDADKLHAISSRTPTFYEPRLEELLNKALSSGCLKLSTSAKEAVLASDITFITVGTPSRSDGSINLAYVAEAAKSIGEALAGKDEWHLVVVKSTVTPTATEQLVRKLLEDSSGKKCGEGFGLCSNPEFLREGSAVEDTFRPDRIIIGEVDKRSGDVLEMLYRKFYGSDTPTILRTSTVNAELIKYANNVFLAMKVSFINMMANVCQRLPGADVEEVAAGIGMDKRIGPLFLKAGAGWGGSCWPKDLAALRAFAKKIGLEMPLVDATREVNRLQPLHVVQLVEELVGGLRGKKVAVLGLAFKPGTDDMREAVSLTIISQLLRRGAKISAYDPKAVNNARRILGESVEFAPTALDCISGADVAVLVTEWPEFKQLKPEEFVRNMRRPAVVDARRVFNPQDFAAKGVEFRAVGLGT